MNSFNYDESFAFQQIQSTLIKSSYNISYDKWNSLYLLLNQSKLNNFYFDYNLLHTVISSYDESLNNITDIVSNSNNIICLLNNIFELLFSKYSKTFSPSYELLCNFIVEILIISCKKKRNLFNSIYHVDFLNHHKKTLYLRR